MTIIAYKDGLMAADSLVSSNGTSDGYTAKLARNKAGDLLGCCGDTAWCHAMLQWFVREEKGKRPHLEKNSDGTWLAYGMLVRVADKVKVWQVPSSANVPTFSVLIDKAWGYALGSGGDVARGAMFAGADARTAAIAACSLVNSCGGDIHVVGHRGPLRTLVASKGYP
jgi:ATP-dependent protease HslVU (ClpYQ) peptidase subunit